MSGGVSVPCRHATPVANALCEPLYTTVYHHNHCFLPSYCRECIVCKSVLLKYLWPLKGHRSAYHRSICMLLHVFLNQPIRIRTILANWQDNLEFIKGRKQRWYLSQFVILPFQDQEQLKCIRSFELYNIFCYPV